MLPFTYKVLFSLIAIAKSIISSDLAVLTSHDIFG